MEPGDSIGPGILLKVIHKDATVFVDMAGRLWKCAREQARPATEDEELSAELAAVLSQDLLREVASNRHFRYVDVMGDILPEDDGPAPNFQPQPEAPGGIRVS